MAENNLVGHSLESAFYDELSEANISELPTLEDKKDSLEKLINDFREAHKDELDSAHQKATTLGSQFKQDDSGSEEAATQGTVGASYFACYQAMLDGDISDISDFL